MRQLIGAVEEAVQIVVVRGVRALQAKVGRCLTGCAPDVFGAGAGVVGPDLVAAKAAKKLGDGLAGRLAEQVPQRDVEGRVAAGFGTGRPKTEVADQIRREQIDLLRVTPDHARCDVLVHIGFDGFGGEEGFAQPDEALVGVNMQPQQVRMFLDPDRFDLGDLHREPLGDAGRQQGLHALVEMPRHQIARCLWIAL